MLIAGGGLAGLTLAVQLKQSKPELDIHVLEEQVYPMPVAAHKVGESTADVGAHYFANTLGLKPHLEAEHLRKFGMRFFFGGTNPGQNLADYDELGLSRFLPVTTYQIDRGLFENHLAATARDLGVTVRDGAALKSLTVGDAKQAHRALVRAGEMETRISSRWLVDSTGRRARLKNQLGLHEPVEENKSAVWLRCGASLDVDRYGAGSEWHARCGDTPRRLSTNHFMGSGYWLWLIPLGSGATSIGLVLDPKFHDIADVSSSDKLTAWLAKREPVLARMLTDHRDTILDFRMLRNFSHGCRQVFSSDRWALSGDAGVFSDPFYSPGSDFISISNTIITQLVTRETKPHRQAHLAAILQQLYLSVFDSNLSLYQSQYGGFGDRDLLLLKTIWDFAYYWAVLANLFFTGRITDVRFLGACRREVDRALAMNEEMQAEFRLLAACRRSFTADGRFSDHASLPLLAELKHALVAPGDDGQAAFSANVALLERLLTILKGLCATSGKGQDLGPLEDLAVLRNLSASGVYAG